MLIADSGSTKTDWAWIENGTIVHRATTAGINPVHQTEEDIEKVVTQLFPRKEDGVRTKEITINYKLSSINFHLSTITYPSQQPFASVLQHFDDMLETL